jgi:hypothetical protein
MVASRLVNGKTHPTVDWNDKAEGSRWFLPQRQAGYVEMSFRGCSRGLAFAIFAAMVPPSHS